jgi:hypothetical protein
MFLLLFHHGKGKGKGKGERGRKYRFISGHLGELQELVVRTVEVRMLVHLETEAVSEPVREVGSVGAFCDYVSVTRAPVRSGVERTGGEGWGEFG